MAILWPVPILAARITSDAGTAEQAQRFLQGLFDNRFDSIDCVVWGAVLLGVTCGLLGSFIILRRQSLMGDAIGHAVLPGVCLGFMAAGERSLPFLLGGAMVAGLLAAGLIGVLQRTTRLKSGECMGLVFTGFYGLGIVLYKYILSGAHAGQSGLDRFLFGQIAGISLADVMAMLIVAVVCIIAITVCWRALTISTFDPEFAFASGYPVVRLGQLLTVLLTAAIVISIQAVGVVLVSAMLVTPAAAAYLLTDRLRWMVLLSAIFGAIAGVVGAFFSMIASDAPTGGSMVLAASSVFAAVSMLSPRYGLLPRMLRLWQRRRRTAGENLLRTLYVLLEQRQNPGCTSGAAHLGHRTFTVSEVAAARRESTAQVRRVARWSAQRGRQWIERAGRDLLTLTNPGLEEARRVVRNHRVWELFLTQEAHLPTDHVHADAEYIEHVLPRDVLRRLEQMLEQPTTDPHGTPIPQAGNGGGAT